MPVMHIHSMETGGRALSTVASHCSCDKYLSTVSECLAIPVCLRELLTTSSGGGAPRRAAGAAGSRESVCCGCGEQAGARQPQMLLCI